MAKKIQKSLYVIVYTFIQLILCCSYLSAESLQPIPALTGPVVDLTNSLSPEENRQISQKLIRFQQNNNAQMAVLIVLTTQPEDSFSYSMRVVDAWQLGSAENDDGILLLIAKNDRKTQIQTGYGIEGLIPDIIAKSLLMEVLAPSLRQGNFAEGINLVIDQIEKRIKGEITDKSISPAYPKLLDKDNQSWLILAFIGGYLISLISSKKTRPIISIIIGGLVFTIIIVIGYGFLLALFGAILTLFFGNSSLGSSGVFPGGLGRGGLGGGLGRGGFSGRGGGFGGGGSSGSW